MNRFFARVFNKTVTLGGIYALAHLENHRKIYKNNLKALTKVDIKTFQLEDLFLWRD